MRTLERQFELNENDEVRDRGGEHAGKSTSGNIKQSTPRYWLRVIDDDIKYIFSLSREQNLQVW